MICEQERDAFYHTSDQTRINLAHCTYFRDYYSYSIDISEKLSNSPVNDPTSEPLSLHPHQQTENLEFLLQINSKNVALCDYGWFGHFKIYEEPNESQNLRK